MIAMTFLKCMMLANFQVEIIQTPIDEYAMATINHLHNGALFEGTVVEGKLNSVSIEIPSLEAKTLSYAMRDHEQVSLSTRLDVKTTHASIDCEIVDTEKFHSQR
jgi:hypothetical protein